VEVAHDIARDYHGSPRGTARKDPLLARDPARHRERVAITDAYPAVDHGRVIRPRKEVLADTLGQVGSRDISGQDGSLGVGADHLDLRVALLQDVPDTRDRAAGPDARD